MLTNKTQVYGKRKKMIKFLLKDNGKAPKRGSVGAAGLDIATNEFRSLCSKERQLFKTGVYLADCPDNIYLRVAPRSKLAHLHGIDVLAGVVDSDYRGEICVILYNTSEESFIIREGDKIAQLIPEVISDMEIAITTESTFTERGKSGINDKDMRLQHSCDDCVHNVADYCTKHAEPAIEVCEDYYEQVS